MFKVSVIIPVYNAEIFVRTAVESAVHLDEVGEIILIEDNSPDNALKICQQLELEYNKVKLYRHPNGENKGAGASRNLGVKNAKYEFIAFLDADDFYLPNRFQAAKEIFSKNNEVDGVYDAVGIKFYDENLRLGISRKWELTTIPDRTHGKALFETLLQVGKGHFCTDGITIRKSLVDKFGAFNEKLRLHQDTELWIKLAYHGNIVPGVTDKPVAIRGVHEANRIFSSNFASKGKLYKSLFEYFQGKALSRTQAELLFKNYILYNKVKFDSSFLNQISNIIFAAVTAFKYPKYLRNILYV